MKKFFSGLCVALLICFTLLLPFGTMQNSSTSVNSQTNLCGYHLAIDDF